MEEMHKIVCNATLRNKEILPLQLENAIALKDTLIMEWHCVQPAIILGTKFY